MHPRTSRLASIQQRLGLAGWASPGDGPRLTTADPTTGEVLAEVRGVSQADYDRQVDAAAAVFRTWRERPAPARGEVIRALGGLLREHKETLGELVSLEVGKIRSEGLGEVQEMIDICDFAVGLSRQLHGLTIASERPQHRMMEQWHPLGPVGIVTAFNFPVAVWAWNAALAVVCGDPVLWKPSPHAPLCALAVHALAERAAAMHAAAGVFGLCLSDHAAGSWMAADRRLPLVSFTGSSAVGREVAATVAGRLGRSLLELGGNNAITVLADADLELAVRGIAFGAVGTAGQRCTTTRRLFVERPIAGALIERLAEAYRKVPIGDPLELGTLVGPLVSAAAVDRYRDAIARARAQGGTVLVGGEPLARAGHFVAPTLIAAPPQAAFPIAFEETFAPILYVFTVDSLDEAIEANNAVSQGLSSALFTDSVRASERFLSAAGADTGIANINIGTSGAEIGGAFGGEKDTGGGRESGSDAWRAYMRRQTCTINYGSTLPLAQGVSFL